MASTAFLQIVKDKCWKITLLLAYATIGFIPVLISILRIDNLFVNFSRLWCLSFFAGVFFIGLYNKLVPRKGAYLNVFILNW
jgi:hypothetical protein